MCTRKQVNIDQNLDSNSQVRQSPLRRTVAWLTLIAYIGQPMLVTAQVIADQAAAANNRPVIDSTANGLPLVQIATPNAAGVSHNQYTQFNVDPAGVILNNSQNTVLTQQAGYVVGNQNLANGTARVILNEVTSTNRSQLNGYTEVAGQQAEVIIANPNGITCNGCGFINTSRGVLTTGTPVMGASGSLDALRVTGGDIQIGSSGLNGSNLSQLDLIARSVQVNGQLWANNLNVITGANLANYNTLGVQIIPGTGNKPTVGIDMALLGGMYANKIRMVGTEAGVGVSSLGSLSAQAGDFVLDNQGQITLAGTTTASANLTVNSGTSISNSGTLYSQQATQLTSTGNIGNTGILAAQGNLTLNSASLNSTGTLGAGIANTGAVMPTGNLIITTSGQALATGQNVSGGGTNITATNIDLSGAQSRAAGAILLNASGAITNNNASLLGAQVTSNSASFNNNGGSVGASGNISLTATTLNNTNGLIGNAQNGGGSITLNTTGNLTNTGGLIGSDQDLLITASTITGNGQAIAGRDANISLLGNYTNAAGNVLKANRNLTLNATGNFINQTALEAVGNLSLTAANITNQSGALINANTGNINTAGTLTNQGTIVANSKLTASANVISNSGTLVAGDMSLGAKQLIENVGPSAFIGASNALGTLELLAPSIQNRDDTTATDTPASAMIYGQGKVILAGSKNALGQYANATQVLNQSALLQSGGDMSVYANTLTNTRRVLQMSNTFTPTGTRSGTGVWTPGSTVPGGAYPFMGVGGAINSSYLYTSYTSTTAQNSPTAISPSALIVSGGNFTPSVATLQNYWSRITAAGTIPLAGVTVDQNSWRGATPFLQRTTSTGDWWYLNYTGVVWTMSCGFGWIFGVSCGNAWGPQIVDTPLPGYDSSITAKTITATGAKINNVAPASATIPLGAQSSRVTSNSAANTLTLPQGGLYNINTAPGAKYLVATNPAFANRNQWLSSDWYFAHANIDPTTIQKRLGDGFYEQQLVRDALLSLTGRAVLSRYADEQTQFVQLMTSGAKLAMTLHITPGIGLSAAQAAQLTDDVIIMETRVVQGEKVLVPVVYLAQVHSGDLLASGPLIAANNIALNDTQAFVNSGMIKADNSLSISGLSLDNRGGNLNSGGMMRLNSVGDIDLTSARLKAGSLALKTGGNLLLNTGVTGGDSNVKETPGSNVVTERASNASATGLVGAAKDSPVFANTRTESSPNQRSSTLLGRIAGMDIAGDALIQTGGDFELNSAQLKVGGDLTTNIQGNWQIGTQQTRETTRGNASGVQYFTDNIQHTGSVIQVGGQSSLNIGKDFIAQGAQIKLQGGGNINAGGNVELQAVKNSFKSDSSTTTSDHYGRNQSFDETLVGTNLQSVGALTITSGKDITLNASTVSVKNGNATLAAAGNVNLLADTEQHISRSEDFSSKNNVVSNTRRTSLDEVNRTQAVGSRLDGGAITIQSGKDINVTGSDVSAKQDITLLSMGDINIKAATETYQATHKREAVTNGLIGSGMGMTVGQDKQSTETTLDGATQSQSRSHLSSSNGNVRLMSGNNTLIVGSDLAAAQGKLSVAAGGGIGIFAGQDTLKQYTETQHTQDTDVFSKQKRVITDTLISSRYQGSTLAGNSIALDAGANLVLQAAQLNSKGDTNIAAGGDLKLLSATDSTYRKHTETLQTDGIAINDLSNGFDDRRKNSSVTSKIDTNQVTRINSGGNLSTRSGGNTLIEASTLNADGSIDLKAGYDAKGNVTNPAATLTLAAVKDSNYLSVEDKHSSLSWQSQSGSGHYTETVKLANIKAGTLRQAQGERSGLSVDATGGVIVDIPEVAAAPAPSGLQAAQLKAPLTAKEAAQAEAEQKLQDAQRLTEHLNTLAKQPGQEWIAQLAKDPKLNVQFKQVSAAAQQWNYSHDGLTPEAAGVIVIVVTYFTAGVASGAAGGIVAGAGATGASAAVASAALAAGMTTLASQASLALINNKGDLGKTLDDMGKSENVKALATAMVTAGVLSQLNQTLNLSNVNAQSGFADQLQKNVINQSSSALINHAINGGDLSKQLEQSLKSAFIDTGAAQGANLIGDLKQNGTLDTYTHKLAHAIAGCAAGAAKSNDCSSGALGAVVGEITAELYAPNNGTPLTAKQQTDTINFSKMIAGVAAALTGNDVNVAAGAAGNAAENNWLNHNRPSLLALSEKERYDQAAKDCGSGNAAQCSVATNLRNLSNGRDRQLNLACAGAPSSTCAAAAKEAILAGNDVFTGPDGRLYATSKTLPALSNQNRPQGFDQQLAPSVIDAALMEAGNGVIAGVVKGGAAAMEVLGLSARGAEVGVGIANSVSASVVPLFPAEQLAINKAAGNAFESQIFNDVKAQMPDAVQQVTVQTQSGIKTRLDILGTDANGNIVCIECKASSTAPLTINQKIGFPEISQTGATIVGNGKPGFLGGTTIPPTVVQIVRPNSLPLIGH
jgi:filamentous hemagglutinin family protein